MVFVPDQKHLLLISVGLDLVIYDITKNKVVTVFRSLHGSGNEITSFDCPNNLLAVSVSMNSSSIVLVDITSGQKIKEIPTANKAPITSVLVSDSGKQLWLGTAIGSLLSYDIPTGEWSNVTEGEIGGGIASLERVPGNFKL